MFYIKNLKAFTILAVLKNNSQNTVRQSISTNKFNIYMYSHDVLCLHFYANNVIELNDISETLEIGNNLSSSNSTRVVVWVEKYVKITKETREYAQYNMRELKYEAQVFPSLANKIVFNLFIKLRKNNHPLKA